MVPVRCRQNSQTQDGATPELCELTSNPLPLVADGVDLSPTQDWDFLERATGIQSTLTFDYFDPN